MTEHPLDPTSPDPHHDLAHRLRRWVRPAVLIALATSLALHLLFLVIAALIIFSRTGSDAYAPGSQAQPIEFAVISAEELAALAHDPLDADSPPVPESAPNQQTPEIELLDPDLGAQIQGLTSDTAALTPDLGGGDVSAGDLGLDGAGGGSATFFGVEASGSRFAYIVDVSGSMSVEHKIQDLRAELAASISNLLEHSRFCVVAYNEAAHPMGGRVEWTEASAGGKEWALRVIESIDAGGGTNPLPAFEQVFTLRPRPDAIYFMTDGEFDPTVADQIRALNRRADIPIHTICFRTRASEELMKRIARESGGRYSFVGGP